MNLPASPEELSSAVRNRYSKVGETPDDASGFRVGRAFAEALGYPADVLSGLPASVCESFTGVAAAALLAEVRPGQTVVDLGSGGGLDLILLAHAAGPTGRVIGIDFAPGMVERSRANVAELALGWVRIDEAPAEATGLPDACADWVVVNGLLNLTPDKAAVLHEIARILKPTGELLLAETTLRAPLSDTAIQSVDDWFR